MNLEQLTNLSDDELNRMAAEKVMGWRWNDLPPHKVGWLDAANQVRVTWLGTWSPATDRNQSGELLAAMTERGASFEVDWYGREHVCTGVSWNLDNSEVHGYLRGNDARGETIAALMAHFAMEETTHAL